MIIPMDDEFLWALIFIIYLVPFWLWQFSNYIGISIRKTYKTERGDEGLRERRLFRASTLWCIGVSGILVAWNAKFPPIISTIVIIGALFAVASLMKRFDRTRHND